MLNSFIQINNRFRIIAPQAISVKLANFGGLPETLIDLCKI